MIERMIGRSLAAAVLAWAILPAPAAEPMPTGVNVAPTSYLATAWPFKDCLKSAAYWPADGGLDDPHGLGAPAVRPDGWPDGLAPGQRVAIPIGTASLPPGDYRVAFRGKGRIQFWLYYGDRGPPQQFPQFRCDGGEARAAGQFTIEAPLANALTLYLEESDPADPVHDVRVMLPGFDPDDPDAWHPDYVASLKPFRVLRLMDPSGVINSTVSDWAERPPAGRYTWAARLPYEAYGELARRTGADLWACVPPRATDDYARRMAETLAAACPPPTRIYLEYANENWNLGFAHATWMIDRATASGMYTFAAEDKYRAGRTWSAWRSKAIHDLARPALGDRLVPVVGVQFGDGTAREALDEYVTRLGGPPPTIAVAPYLGGSLGQPEAVPRVKALGVAGLIAELRTGPGPDDLPATVARAKAVRAVCDEFSAPLVAYECGPHLVGAYQAAGDDELTALFLAANRDPAMGDLATAYLEGLAPHLDLACWYSDCGPWSRFGSWGARERQDDADAPKWRALVAYANRPTSRAGGGTLVPLRLHFRLEFDLEFPARPPARRPRPASRAGT